MLQLSVDFWHIIPLTAKWNIRQWQCVLLVGIFKCDVWISLVRSNGRDGCQNLWISRSSSYKLALRTNPDGLGARRESPALSPMQILGTWSAFIIWFLIGSHDLRNARKSWRPCYASLLNGCFCSQKKLSSELLMLLIVLHLLCRFCASLARFGVENGAGVVNTDAPVRCTTPVHNTNTGTGAQHRCAGVVGSAYETAVPGNTSVAMDGGSDEKKNW